MKTTVFISIVLLALHQCQLTCSSSTTDATTVASTDSTVTETDAATSTTESVATSTTESATTSTTAGAVTESTTSSTPVAGATDTTTNTATVATTAAASDPTGSTTAAVDSTGSTTAAAVDSTGSTTAAVDTTGSSAAATGATDPTSSTAGTVYECFAATCNGSGCLTNVSKENNFAVCTTGAGGKCKLEEDASGDAPKYTMSCYTGNCEYTITNGEITENCCTTDLCNNDIKLLSGSTTLFVSAWSIVVPCLYMLAV